MFDTRILNGILVSDGVSWPADIGIVDEAIVEVGSPGALAPATDDIDASGLLVIPGAVDAHFHCRAPSHPERADFGSETRAAAASGVTTVFEMPVSNPPCSTPEVLEARRQLIETDSYIDVALFAGAAVKGLQHAQALAEAGAIGFKLFTHAPSADRAEEFEGLWASSEETIYHALAAIGPTGLPCTVHAENQALLGAFNTEATGKGISARPAIIEALAISIVGMLARDLGTRVHIAHLTSRLALDAFRGARASGARITAETCPHYLVLDDRAIDRWGGFVKVAPPLRTADDIAALWDALNEGLLTIVASDHAPFLPEEKSAPDYNSAPQGIPSIEALVPVMIDAGITGRLPIEQAVGLMTAEPAKLFGLFPHKGAVAPGSDADIVLIDPQETRTLSSDSFMSRSARSAVAYDGLRLRGRVTRTILRGRTVSLNGAVIGQPRGRFVQPARKPIRQ